MRVHCRRAGIHLGDAVHVVHFVRRGAIHLVRTQEDGSALILQRARAGSILAEASVYSDRYHCGPAPTATRLRGPWRKRTCAAASTQTQNSLWDWARHLAHEVQRARLHAEILSLKTVAARLSAWLFWNGALPEKGQWHRIADEIGVTPEAFYRELAKRKRTRPATSVARSAPTICANPSERPPEQAELEALL